MSFSPSALLQVIAPTERILVAVSGGLDSVVLLHALVSAGIPAGVAHVNFGLRAAESDADQEFVAGLAAQYKVPFYTTRFQTAAFAAEQGISVQMAARELRYKWFEEIRQQEGFSAIATAHHLNDNLETALLNLVRGTGPAGLAGIKPRSANLVRPLLGFSREEIEEYARAHSLSWREDSSNSSHYYKRNFLRHQVIPLLRQLNPNLLRTFQETSQRLSDATELVQEQAEQVKMAYEEGNPGFWRIYKSNLPEAGTALVLLEVLRPFSFTYRQAQEILAALNGQSGKRFFSPTHQLLVDRDQLFISTQLTPANEAEITIAEDEELVKLSTGYLWLVVRSANGYAFPANPSVTALDNDKLTFPLRVRRWQQGDRFKPLGSKGSKKVSDLLIDRKVPLTQKEQVQVLLSGKEIAWVIGYQISDLFKINQETSQVLELTHSKTE